MAVISGLAPTQGTPARKRAGGGAWLRARGSLTSCGLVRPCQSPPCKRLAQALGRTKVLKAGGFSCCGGHLRVNLNTADRRRPKRGAGACEIIVHGACAARALPVPSLLSSPRHRLAGAACAPCPTRARHLPKAMPRTAQVARSKAHATYPKRYSVTCRYTAPGRRITPGKCGRLGLSGKCWGSRQRPEFGPYGTPSRPGTVRFVLKPS